jgi:hypothetical protein
MEHLVWYLPSLALSFTFYEMGIITLICGTVLKDEIVYVK